MKKIHMQADDHIAQETTPFISSDSYLAESEVQVSQEISPELFLYENDTPFLTVYEAGDHEDAPDPEEDEITEFIAELYDEELNQALYELANEASEWYESELETEFNSDSEYQRTHLQSQVVEEYSDAFAKELGSFFDALISSSEEIDIAQMSDTEIDAWVDRHIADHDGQLELAEEEELFEGFKRLRKWGKKLRNKAKKLRKKIGKAVKKGAKKIKKGIKKAAKFIKKKLLGRMLRKLRKLIFRFLKKVINSKFVKKHLPPKYRELFLLIAKLMNKKRSRKLAKKARGKLGKKVRRRRKEVEEFEFLSDEYAYLQHELDIQIANLISAETEEEEDQIVADYEQEEIYPDEETLKELDLARDRFAREISQLQEGEDPSPHVERFVTAILQAIRVVLQPIIVAYGRTKTINNIIAPLIFKILTRFIKGKNKRPILKSLSRVLGDIGLKVLLKMEVSEEIQEEAAADAIANITEETLNEIAQLPAYVFEDNELAQAYAMETFERMAGANLPPILSEAQYLANPDLRESSIKGSWVAYRSKKRRGKRRGKRLKKYMKVFRNKKLSPHLMKTVKAFGDRSIAEFLNEQMDIPANQMVEANVHLYEAMHEADLYQIGSIEENVPGLNIEPEFAYQLFHPLTPLNAGLLLGEPGLGRRVDPIFMATPAFIRPGQRFFYLEVGNARPKVVMDKTGATHLRRLSELNQSFNFIRNEIKIHFFLSERKAQEITALLKGTASYGPALSHLLKVFNNRLNVAMSPVMIHKRTRIIHPDIAPGPNSGLEFAKVIPEFLQELFKDRLTIWTAQAIGSFMKEHAQKFVSATQDDDDGVVLKLSISMPPGFSTLKKALSSYTINIPPDFLEGQPERMSVKVKPGFDF